MNKLICASIVSLVMATSAANAAPIDFTFTVSGTAGAWTYDFSVKNNLGAPWQIYFFGVALPNAINPVSALGMATDQVAHWTNYHSNGSNVDYNVNWLNDYSFRGVAPGQTGHFLVSDTSASTLSAVKWYAYAYTGSSYDVYTGSPYFGAPYNPGFEGINGTILPPYPVPEPETYAMLLAGLGLVGVIARRRKLA